MWLLGWHSAPDAGQPQPKCAPSEKAGASLPAQPHATRVDGAWALLLLASMKSSRSQRRPHVALMARCSASFLAIVATQHRSEPASPLARRRATSSTPAVARRSAA